MADYSEWERRLLRSASCVFFPTLRFADVLHAIGVPTFPSLTTHRYQRSRIHQHLLLSYLGLPRPETRMYYGPRQKARIGKDFSFPVRLAGPATRRESVHRIGSYPELAEYCQRYNPVLVQPWNDWSERFQLLCVGFECVGVRRLEGPGDSGGIWKPFPLSHAFIRQSFEKTLGLVQAAHLDDIVVEWGIGEEGWRVIQMHRPPRRWPALSGDLLNRHHHIAGLIEEGRL
jgi:hypothetical protein